MHSTGDKLAGQITVTYSRAGTDWKLSIADNGVGKSDGVLAYEKSGLGTGIIKALSNQLDAQVETSDWARRHNRVDHSRHVSGEGSGLTI